ncbi:MAG: isoprenylcysteine carboxylmethyltransferase family protein [Acidobacteriota bacterium]|nr:isoprenylcysteine carboxylmethyltransferase family protein [Acidobacteriota bacterium]
MPSLLLKSFTILRGIVYSAGFVWLWAWLVVSVRRYDSGIPIALPLWLRPVGFVLASVGALIAGACIATFVTRGRGTPAPFDPPREFVATGPYRWVRNPMYVGAAAVILGAGLVLSSPSVVLLAFAFVLVMHLFVVLHEERALTERFGDAYDQYRSSVHRWWIRKPVSGGRRAGS